MKKTAWQREKESSTSQVRCIERVSSQGSQIILHAFVTVVYDRHSPGRMTSIGRKRVPDHRSGVLNGPFPKGPKNILHAFVTVIYDRHSPGRSSYPTAKRHDQIQYCFTFTQTIRTIRDREPRTATSKSRCSELWDMIRLSAWTLLYTPVCSPFYTPAKMRVLPHLAEIRYRKGSCTAHIRGRSLWTV